MIEDAKELKFLNVQKTAIMAHVKFADSDDWIPYVLSKSDVVSYSRTAFQKAVTGAFGDIEKYVPEVITDEAIAQQVRIQRDAKLAELDVLISNPLRWAEFSEQLKESLQHYRTALLDVPQQSTFPKNVVWPVLPSFLP